MKLYKVKHLNPLRCLISDYWFSPSPHRQSGMVYPTNPPHWHMTQFSEFWQLGLRLEISGYLGDLVLRPICAKTRDGRLNSYSSLLMRYIWGSFNLRYSRNRQTQVNNQSELVIQVTWLVISQSGASVYLVQSVPVTNLISWCLLYLASLYHISS